MNKYAKKCVVNAIICAVAIVIAVVCALLSLSTAISEAAARSVSRGFTYVFGHVVSVVPFSFFEVLVAIAFILAVALIVRGIVFLAKRQTMKGVSSFVTLVTIVLCVVCIYTVDTCFAYNRERPPLDIYENGELENEEYLVAVNNFFEDYFYLASKMERNEDGLTVSDMSVSEISDLIADEYKKLEDDYYSDYIPKAKGMASSGMMSALSLAGITFAPIGEANVNKDMPLVDIVTTTAHELAHTMGIMREEDADLVSLYVLLSSDNELLRYSACTEVYGRMLWIQRYIEGEESVEKYTKDERFESIRKEILACNEYWTSHAVFAGIADFFNNLYLKFNGQNLGTGSYDDSNFSDATDTGELDDDGNVIYDITLSRLQLAVCSIYYTK